MGTLDIEALRKKHENLKGQDQRSSAFWKPKEGRQILRIIPWKDRPENPFIELYFHYLGGKSQLSPISNGNRDPINEFAEKLRAEGSKESYQQSRDFMAKLRTYVPVVVRGEEESGVRLWAFGKTVYQEILGYIADPDYGDITCIETGRDVVVDYTPVEKSDTNFPKTKCHPKPDRTPLSQDGELVEHWLTTQPDVDKLFKEPSFDDLTAFLRSYLDPDSDDEDTTESVTQHIASPNLDNAGLPISGPSTSEPEKVSSTLDEFDKLFAN